MRFNVEFLEDWLSRNKPYAMQKLSDRTKHRYSVPAIEKLRRVGHVPRPENLKVLAEVMDTDIATLVLIEQPSRKRTG